MSGELISRTSIADRTRDGSVLGICLVVFLSGHVLFLWFECPLVVRRHFPMQVNNNRQINIYVIKDDVILTSALDKDIVRECVRVCQKKGKTAALKSK